MQRDAHLAELYLASILCCFLRFLASHGMTVLKNNGRQMSSNTEKVVNKNDPSSLPGEDSENQSENKSSDEDDSSRKSKQCSSGDSSEGYSTEPPVPFLLHEKNVTLEKVSDDEVLFNQKRANLLNPKTSMSKRNTKKYTHKAVNRKKIQILSRISFTKMVTMWIASQAKT